MFCLFSSSLQWHACILSPTRQYQNIPQICADTNIANISFDTNIISVQGCRKQTLIGQVNCVTRSSLIVSYISHKMHGSRHTVVCQWPRKPCDSQSRHTVVCQWPRKPCDSQVCYLQEPLTRRFQLLIRISVTTGLIFIKFTYFMPSIYTTLCTKFKRNRSSCSRVMCS